MNRETLVYNTKIYQKNPNLSIKLLRTFLNICDDCMYVTTVFLGLISLITKLFKLENLHQSKGG
jgi:hypothetical protein